MHSGAGRGSALLSLLIPSFGDQAGTLAGAHFLRDAASADDRDSELIIGSGGEALNQLLSRATGDWVLLVDDSLVIDASGVAALQAAARLHGRADVIYFDWQYRNVGLIAPDRQRAALSLHPADVMAQGWPSQATAAMLMRRCALTELGGYDGRYRQLASAEAALRLAQNGALFRRSPDTVLEFAPRRLDPAGLRRHLDEALCIVRFGQMTLPASGSTSTHAETSVFFHALGMAIGAKTDPWPLISHPSATLAPDFGAAPACAAFLDGIASTCHIGEGEVAAGWTGLRLAAAPALTALAPRFAWPEFARSVLRIADRRLAARCRPGEALDLGAERTVTFDLKETPADLVLDSGIERLQGIVVSHGGEIGRFHIGPTGLIAQNEIAAILDDFRGAVPADAPSPATVGAAMWEERFVTEDPWDYDGPYEDCKARQTLDIIPDGLGAVLELACAEGHFTRRLAGKVGQLTATDISATALVRAARRCRDFPSVRFAQLDLLRDPMPQDRDLIVCSEVLYYVEDIDALVHVADRIAGALRPGGHLVMTHANLVSDRDNPQMPGFRWNHAFGALTIGRVFAQSGALYLAEEHRSALYRIQRFRKPADGERPSAPIYRDIAFDERLSANAAATIDWAGHPPNPETWSLPGVPVLTYHRIASDPPPALARYATAPAQFAEQMQWLAKNGHATISLGELEAAIWDGAALPERAVAITFDDGYLDNLTAAAATLRDFDQRATLFVPTAHVGGAADWDGLFGPAAPLMSWAELERLRASGFEIASHGQRHRPMTALAPRELADELQGARAALLGQLGVTTTLLAYPYGDHDQAVQRAALAAGYRLAFTTVNRRWRPGDQVMTIPRIEVTGGLTSDEFAALVRTE